MSDVVTKFKIDLTDFKAGIQDARRNLQLARSEFRATAAGTDDWRKSTEGLTAKIKETNAVIDAEKAKLKALADEHAKVAAEQGENSDKAKELEAQMNNQAAKVLKAEKQLEQYKAELEELNRTHKTASERLQEVSDKTKTFGDGMVKAGQKTRYMSLMAAGLLVGIGKAAIDFETAWTGVLKTVDGTPEELEAIRKGILDLAQSTSSSSEEIAAVAEAAGQLGIETPNILEFTKTMVMLGDTTNLSAEQAATALAKFANITKMAPSDYSKLGSVIVDLGNNFATTEADIVEMATRLAATGDLAGLSEPQIMALAAAMSSVGIEAQAGGSAMSKLLKDIQLSTELGGERLEQFASVAGMSADEFKRAFAEDGAAALGAFIDGLNDTERNGKSAVQILDEMGLTEVRLSNTILALANSNGIMTDAVETATGAWSDNIALSEEANKRYQTTEAKINQAKETIKALGIEIGAELLPIISDALEVVKDWVKRFSDMDDGTKRTILKVLAFTAALSPMLSGIGRVSLGVSSLTGTLAKLTAKAGAEGATGATSVFSKLWSVMAAHPYAAVAVGAGVALVAILKLSTGADKYTQAMRDTIGEQEKNIAAVDEQGAKAEYLAKKIDELSRVENKSVGEKARMTGLVGELNSILPDLGLVYDENKDKLNMSTDAIYRNVDALKLQAKAVAYQEAMQAVYAELVDQEIKLVDAKDRLTKAEEAYQEAVSKGLVGEDLKRFQDELNLAQGEVDDLTASIAEGEAQINDYGDAIDATKNLELFDKLVADAGIAANKIPSAIREGIAAGKYQVPQSINELKMLMNPEFEAMWKLAQEKGVGIPPELAKGIEEGSVTAEQAAASLKDAVNEKLKKDGKAQKEAKKEIMGFAAGIGSGKGPAKAQATGVKGAAQSGVSGGYSSSHGSGANFGQGFVDGIRTKLDAARNAAIAMAREAIVALMQTIKQASPSKITRESGEMFGLGFALGIADEADEAARAARGLARATSQALESESRKIALDAGTVSEFAGAIKTSLAIESGRYGAAQADVIRHAVSDAIMGLERPLQEGMRQAVDGMGVSIDKREIGRIVEVK